MENTRSKEVGLALGEILIGDKLKLGDTVEINVGILDGLSVGFIVGIIEGDNEGETEFNGAEV